MAGGRPTDASHFKAVLMETPCFLITADGESVGISPSGTGQLGRTTGCNGIDSRLQAARAASEVTPFSLAT
jgi:hypothetical protein